MRPPRSGGDGRVVPAGGRGGEGLARGERAPGLQGQAADARQRGLPIELPAEPVGGGLRIGQMGCTTTNPPVRTSNVPSKPTRASTSWAGAAATSVNTHSTIRGAEKICSKPVLSAGPSEKFKQPPQRDVLGRSGEALEVGRLDHGLPHLLDVDGMSQRSKGVAIIDFEHLRLAAANADEENALGPGEREDRRRPLS